MPHLDLPAGKFGIIGLMTYRPDTAAPLNQLAEVLLRGPSSLSRGERELIAAYVSSLNKCRFCTGSHAAFASLQLPRGRARVDALLAGDLAGAELSAKMIALLAIAAEVQKQVAPVSDAAVAAARSAGAVDFEIHDTVLIAAAFCMYNRYVDGLATLTSDDPAYYDRIAETIVRDGYANAIPPAAPGRAANGD
jgi:uncharacterized peroxidase-related enzyme